MRRCLRAASSIKFTPWTMIRRGDGSSFQEEPFSRPLRKGFDDLSFRFFEALHLLLIVLLLLLILYILWLGYWSKSSPFQILFFVIANLVFTARLYEIKLEIKISIN